MKTLNENTGIKASLEGAIKLTDSAFFKAPILFMEPALATFSEHKHGSLINTKEPLWKAHGFKNKYTELELAALRRYIVEKGGFLYILAHGNSEIVLAQTRKLLQNILPEHTLQRIPNDHEIYSSYYELGGPLRFPFRSISGTLGANVTSGGTVPLILGDYAPLQGILVQGRLAVLLDTEAAMHILDIATKKPFFGKYAPINDMMVSMAPHAARQLTNVVVYAMTHGGIANYQDYVPELAVSLDDEKIKYTAPAIPEAKF